MRPDLYIVHETSLKSFTECSFHLILVSQIKGYSLQSLCSFNKILMSARVLLFSAFEIGSQEARQKALPSGITCLVTCISSLLCQVFRLGMFKRKGILVISLNKIFLTSPFCSSPSSPPPTHQVSFHTASKELSV